MTATGSSLHRKLAEVMAEAERIPKNGVYSGQGGFKFVQAGDAADAIRKALGSRRVSMLPSNVEVIAESEHETRSGGTMTTLTVRTTWTLVDGDTGETATIQSLGTGADAGDKYSPKAQTNAMKYALLMGFLLSTGDDPELSDSSDRRRRNPATSAEPVQDAPRGQSRSFTGEAVRWQAHGLDGLLRLDPEGVAHYGFILECEDEKKRHVKVDGSLAEYLAGVNPVGQVVTVAGSYRVEDLPKKDGGTYKAGVIYAQSITAPDGSPLAAAPSAPPADAPKDTEIDRLVF